MNEEMNNNVVNNNYEPPKSNNGVKVLLIILILLVLCLIGLTCYKVFVYDKKDNTKPNNNTPVEAKDNDKTNDNPATEVKGDENVIKKTSDDLGESLLPDKTLPIRILVNLLNGRTAMNDRNYKEFDTGKVISNTTFTMKELRNKKKLDSSNINDYIKVISINDNYEIKGENINLTDEEFIDYACKRYGKLGYCNNGEYDNTIGVIDDMSSYSFNQVKDMYKTGILNINSFYSDHKDAGMCNEIFHVFPNESKIMHLMDCGGGNYSTAYIYNNIVDVKNDGKILKVYVKPLQYYLDRDLSIYGVSKLMDSNIIKISPIIETISVVATPADFSQIVNLFDKYDDKLETLVFTFEKNNKGNYVFDYVELE